MGYEIDFLPVGDGESSGDAIAVRFGTDLSNASKQAVIVIDGGTKESGQALVNHVKTFYGTNRVDLVICTHSDADHASGLLEVIEGLTVGVLLMHLPWKHAHKIEDLFANPRVTADGVQLALKKSLDTAHDLEKLARKKGINILEPFSDTITPNVNLQILGPTTKYYEALLPHFRGTPEPLEEPPLLQKIMAGMAEKAAKFAETWGIETLTDPDEAATSAENNSSVILLLSIDGTKFLFTGDAGVPALAEAASRAVKSGINLPDAKFVQVPHHGSRRNVGPTILNHILGPKQPNENYTKSAFISASKGGEPKHPAKKVVNAFMRRGAKVFATQGKPLLYFGQGAPNRNWANATPLPFSPTGDD